MTRARPPWRRRLFYATESCAAKTVSIICLAFAMFANGFAQAFDVPDDPWNTVLDVILCMVTGFFFLETVVNSLGDRNYAFSFFFWMDILGSISLIFEISFLLGPSGKSNEKSSAVDPKLLRAARVAKIAARSGRFLKFTKCLKWILPQKDKDKAELAEVLSAKLSLSVSTKASVLTILLVCTLPLFALEEYPTDDLSLRMWIFRLEQGYDRAVNYFDKNPAVNSSSGFAKIVEDLQNFYGGTDYFPFEIQGYEEQLSVRGREVTIPGAAILLSAEAPRRLQNELIIEVNDCRFARDGCIGDAKASIHFNMGAPKRREAWVEMGSDIFVIFIMCLASANISGKVNGLVLGKLERLLTLSRDASSKILSLGENADRESKEPGGELKNGAQPDECVLLEKALQRLIRLADISMRKNVTSEVGLKTMDREERGVLVELLRVSVGSNSRTVGAMGNRERSSVMVREPLARSATVGSSLSGTGMSSRHSGREESLVESPDWLWDCLVATEDERRRVINHIAIGSGTVRGKFTDGGSGEWIEAARFDVFVRAIVGAYNQVPYHNAFHAVDVMYTVYRYMNMAHATSWMSGVDIVAMLIAALGHDVGHLGQTNQFLIEARRSLALKYNDASPLENMHCAILFRIAKLPDVNLFSGFSIEDFKKARSTMISTILHTDNIHHFEMVKALQTIYEMNSKVCDDQFAAEQNFDTLNEAYYDDVVEQNAVLLKQLLLHAADISNATKPFHISSAWADRALEEFFLQGDLEKDLGLPVGMLNDRDKVNKPASQHGFINFLVAPLMLASMKVLPSFFSVATFLVPNLNSWQKMWIEETEPDESAITARQKEIARIAEQLDVQRPEEFESVSSLNYRSGRSQDRQSYWSHSSNRSPRRSSFYAAPRVFGHSLRRVSQAAQDGSPTHISVRSRSVTLRESCVSIPPRMSSSWQPPSELSRVSHHTKAGHEPTLWESFPCQEAGGVQASSPAFGSGHRPAR